MRNHETGQADAASSGTATILVVDDDPDIRQILRDRLAAGGHRIALAANGQEALERAARDEPDVVLLDLQLPKINGVQVLKKLKEQFPESPPAVIMITAFATIPAAVEAVRDGAFDFIAKPFSPESVALTVSRAIECRALQRENQWLHRELDEPYLDIIGESEGLKAAVAAARTVAATPSTVLLLGETGTGKEIFARSIHRWSPRSGKPFVVINCVALRDELLESELFGHERGAFTGAYAGKVGKLEIADGGTVFLDEIAELKPELQAKLLRVLQDREFERVGGTRTIRVSIRVIAATNRDLQEAIREKQFREDLFFRLNVVSMTLPPLRERREDIGPLSRMFLRRACRAVHKKSMRLSPEAMTHLMQYHWPGNVRELGNVIERAVVLASGEELGPRDFPVAAAPVSRDADAAPGGYYDAMQAYQRELIRRALAHSGGNQARAAELLGVQRTYLHRLVKRLKIPKS